MTRPVPYYKDLCVICDPSSDERECSSSQDLEQQNDEEDTRSPATSISNGSRKNKRQLENMPCLSHSKRLRDNDDGMASAIREMASAVSSLSDRRKNDENSIPIENVIEAVQALPDMDEDLVLDACDLLEDEKKSKTFMALDVKLRRKWLLRKLRPET